MVADHLSELAMMRVLLGEAKDRARVTAHLEECPACAALFAELEKVQSEDGREAPPLIVSEPRSPPLKWLTLALAGVSAAAVLTLIIPIRDVIRPKGGARVEFACKDGARVWQCQSGEHVRPGTAVAIEVGLDAPRWLMLLGRDGTGQWRVYFPIGGEEAVLVEAGVRDPLGKSLMLDQQPGEERFVLVIAPRPFHRAEVLDSKSEPASLRLPKELESVELILRK